MHPAPPSAERRARFAPALLGVAAVAWLGGCGESPPAGSSAAAPALDSCVAQPARTPLERRLDGTVEAVNQGTVAAQTSGRVDAIFYDVNDFVPAGAVIVRLRATEQRAGLLLAQAGEREALARDTEAQTRS